MRLDVYLYKNGYAPSRSGAQALIKEGKVAVFGEVITRSSYDIDENEKVDITVNDECRYVSRGALKLEGALDKFMIDVRDMICVDVGASTGGFTDLLLTRGAKKVYAIDVGSDQLAKKLREDERVISIEHFNARELCEETLGEMCDIAVMDVSFISQKLLFSGVYSVLKDDAPFIALIKPQFETGAENRSKYLSKSGIVKDPKAHINIINSVITEAKRCGFACKALIPSPIHGGDGNIEFLAYYLKNPDNKPIYLPLGEVERAVAEAHGANK